MPRAIWSGAISFGLVNVPVKLYSAVSPKTVRFHQLHAADGVRIQQKRVCPADGEEVAWDEIVKGYEIAPDRYVIIEPGELEALNPKKTRTIDIEDFVDLADIDPIFYDHPYYLAPGPGGAKPYRLLLDAMRESKKVAIARVVIRTKEQLTAIRPSRDALLMSTMIFHDEVIPTDRLDELPDADEVSTSDKELAMARQLVESLAGDFDPTKYTDTYREEVLALIERKAEGKEIAVQPPAEEEAGEVPDLMAALQASLAEVKKRTGDGDGAAAAPKRARSRASANGSGGSGRKPAAARPKAGASKARKSSPSKTGARKR
jgi:DNA end-binding protein Ku